MKSRIESRRGFLRATSAISMPLLYARANESCGAREDRWSAIGQNGVWLNANEFPDGPCAAALAAVRGILPSGGRYMPEMRHELTAALAASTGLPPSSVGIFIGSMEALENSLRAFGGGRRGVVMGQPSFEVVAEFVQDVLVSPLRRVPLTEKTLCHDAGRLLGDSANVGVIYVCNPNNPTGTVTPLEWIRSIVQNKDPDTVVIVDEAYAEFSSTFESALKLVAEGDDVVVLRTFSKIYGLAGLRCGAAFARADLLSKVQALSTNPAPVTALAAAKASLTSAGVVALRRAENRRRRNELLAFFDKEGIRYIPSETNFVLFNTRMDGLDLVRAMRKHNIALPPPPRTMPNHVRVTIGSDGDMKRFREALLTTITGAKIANAR